MTRTFNVEKILIELQQLDIYLWVEDGQLGFDAPEDAFTHAIRDRVLAHKQEIIRALLNSQVITHQPIDKAPRTDKFPLSFAQQRLWFFDQFEPDSALYNIPTIIRLEGQLHVGALEQSFAYLISRHESLRTVFGAIDGEPIQVVREPSPFTLPTISLSDEQQAMKLGQVEANTPFNLCEGPLLRVQLLKITDHEHFLLLNMHHIISDGWSIGVLVKELSHAYTAYAQGNVPTLPELPIQYADFAAWQREYLSGDILSRQLSFWREQLTGAPARLELPTDRPRPPVQSYRGAHYRFQVDADITAKLNQLAQTHDASLFMVLLAGFNVLLSRYSRQTDIVVGTPIANRNRAEIEGLIGFFVNTLALRTELDDNPSFNALLNRVRQTTLAAYEHQDLPFEQLVDELELERTLSYTPLFQVMFVLQNAEIGTLGLTGVRATPHPTEFPFAKFDLTLSLMESDQGSAPALRGIFEYSTDLFDEATMARIASHFAVLLNRIVSQPDQPVLQRPMLTDAEYHKIVHEWNDTAVDFGEAQTIHALFEQQVEHVPDAVALVFGDEQLTYAQLNARANQLAHHLICLGVQPDTLVAVAMERSLEMVISWLAVLKAGGAYVPIDPTYPEERIGYMLKDSAARILLTQSDLSFDVNVKHVIAVDQIGSIDGAISNPQTSSKPQDLAYVIYTSGSTGQPKGVMIQHDQLYNLLRWHQRQFEVTSQDRASQLANPAFDATGWEIFPYLTKGATLFLTPENERLDPLALIKWFASQAITIAFVPTPIANAMLEMQSQVSLKWLLTGGDKLNHYPSSDVDFTLVNNYGPTENTVVATSGIINSEANTMAPHIGQAIDNVQVYVLSEALQLLPINVPGELYIGGTQLARGYLNRPELTAERFIQHPEFGRLYKTGDLCRWRPDGHIEFMGRTDFQVKIRGFRIELGEIESALLAADEVREAVVLARAVRGDKRLVAYFVGDTDTDTLRLKLAQRLPSYMVPSAFVELEAMPLTQNGKLDRRALPIPDYVDRETTFVAPRNEVEASLAQAFTDVLRVGQIGIHDDFFRMGGDSILSIQLASRAAQLGYTLSVKDVFQYPTIAQLATELANVIRTEQSPVHASQEVQIGEAPLLPIQRWFLAANQPEMHHFNQSFLLTVKQPIDKRKLEAAIGSLLRHHDALGFQYRRDESGWSQQYLAAGDRVPLDIVYLQAAPLEPQIEAIGTQTQTSLNPLVGDLTRWVYFRSGDLNNDDRLLIVIHHLAVDGVSWRILLEDLATLLDGGQLPPKTSSYRDWVQTLQSATQQGYFDADISRWLINAVEVPLPLEQPDALNTMGSSHHLRLTLSERQTEHLLRTLPDLHDVTLDAVLLTALTETLTEWSGNDALRVKFESHGRQELFETINLNRTVGWFTSAYPLTIPRFDGSAVKRIRYTLDMLRRVTDGGISFGALRYFHPDDVIREQFDAPEAPVVYNYLGQLDNLHNERFGSAQESKGFPISPHFRRDTLLDSNAAVVNGQLHISWTVSPQIHYETAELLLDTFTHRLKMLMASALDKRERMVIPSEFPNADLTFAQLESLINDSKNKKNIETIYGLSPMQSGMLFHSQLAPDKGTYIEHNLFHVDEPTFDLSRFIQAIQTVIDHHDSLRAAFYDQEVQVIYERATLPVTVLDWRELSQRHAPQSADQHQKQLRKLIEEDRLTDFDFSQAPLLRLAVIQRQAGYDLLFTFHHILMDRWSVDLFWSEVLRSYAGHALASATPYQSYIHYLRQQADDAEFWQDYLSGFYAPTPLPAASRGQEKGEPASIAQTFSFEATQQLTTFARTQGLTLNTLFQAAWGVLLARYTRESDVVFGMVTSGRTAPISGIESILGLFINTLPFRVQLDNGLTGSALLQQVAQTQLEIQQREHMPLVDVQRWSEVPAGSGLFDSLLLFQNTPQTAKMSANELDLRLGRVQPGDTGYPLVCVVAPGESARLLLSYDTARLDAQTAERLLTHWQQLVMGIVSRPDQPVLQLPMLTDAEYHQIVHEFNDTAVDFGEAQTIHALFEAQVERTPDAVALVFDHEQLSYAQLNARANQLAHHLISLGVQADTLVAVAMKPSLEMVVSLLAVLKAGGAYVPIDPTYPSTRIRYMLTDSAAPILLTQSHLEFSHAAEHVIAVDQVDSIYAPISNPQTSSKPEHLAYVIYTSGSTGQPKGVLIEHGGAFNVATAQSKLLPELKTGSRLLQLASLSFDAATFEVMMALMHGMTLVVPPANHDRVGVGLYELLSRQGITHVILVPSVLQTLPAASLPHLKVLITAGEACPNHLVNRWANERVFLNLYGPTESPIWTTYAALQPDQTVHIGQPIPNRRVYILDDCGAVVPIGVPGELYIGGEQLARGYLNRPKLTAERFIEHPEFGRLYKTGDLCRWLPDGNPQTPRGHRIEFMGRTDFQVKIRGFRIELGEIENALLASEGVREAVVLAREDNASDKRLVAYIVGNAHPDLRLKLAQRLPDYMVPSAFFELEAMPLTPNGKLNRRALPAPEYADAQTTFVAPRNEVEASLAQAFAEVLRVPQIGIHDDFFRMGGDSILSIQLVSRAAQLGYTLSVKDVFEYPTIAQLAKIANERATVMRTEQSPVHASQEMQIGDAPLLPIQRWFLEAHQAQWHHFNQSFLLTVKQPIDPIELEAAIGSLLSHHDALRFQYRRDESSWHQQYLAPVDHVPLKVVDLQAIAPELRPAKIEAIGTQSQASLNPLVGDLTRWVYFRSGDLNNDDRLLIAIHHLAVDGVSWRILLEDLATLLDDPFGELRPKTSSYRDWVESVQSATQHGHFDADISRWLSNGSSKDSRLPLEQPDALNTIANSHHLRLTLSERQTEQLLRTLPDRHDVTLDAVLLTALTETLTEWSANDALRVKFESHGRQELFESINLNRTVGWFTSAYPLTIPRFDGTALKRIRYTLDMLRRVTDGGISFGALRYFHPDDGIREQFDAPEAPVVYNYLGQLDSMEHERFSMAPESTGLQVSPHFRRDTLLDSNAFVVNGQLHIRWTVSPQIHYETAQLLLDRFTHRLKMLIASAFDKHERVVIPSEFANADLSFAQLELLINDSKNKIETIYGLSPMQSGMLFHSQLAPDKGTYIEHSLFHVDEPTFDLSRFIQAIQTVIDHHDSLRAAFYDQEVQVIYERATLPVTLLDWRELSQRDAAQSVDQYQKQLSELIEEDRLTDFDFSQAPLLRLAVIERQAGYDLLFTFHHILMDRWSVDLFWSEVLRSYAGHALASATPYQSYIHYLRQQADDAEFWQDYLSGFYAPTPLPGASAAQEKGQPASIAQTFSFEATQQLTTFARTQGLTLNTLFQAAWGVLLARYTRESDVVFGMVTSGRTAPISGIESILGLFINTLPFRVQLDNGLTGSALLQQVAQTQLEIQQREHTPLVDVQRFCEVPTGSGLFDSLLLFQNTPQTAKMSANELDLRLGRVQPGDTGYPLVCVAAQGESATLLLSYDTARYDEHTASRLLTHWQQLVMGIVSHPDQPVLQLPMLTDAESHQIVHEFNNTAVDFGEAQTIHSLFEQQVEHVPDAVALVFGDQQLTYYELNTRANQLAHHLISLGTKGTLVAVAMKRSLEMVISWLAVLKAGGAYVPIDPTYPEERIGYMLTDSAAPILLTQSHLELAHAAEHVIAVDRVGTIDGAISNPQTSSKPQDLAYVIYTSGSTGQPKGVMIQHDQLYNLLRWHQREFEVTSQDRASQLANPAFDATGWEIFPYLTKGATLFLTPENERLDPRALIKWFAEQKITTAFVPTPIANVMLEMQSQVSLKWLLTGGDKLNHYPSSDVDFTLVNNYGPTENTVVATSGIINSDGNAMAPHIGQAIDNVQVYVLSEELQPLPINIPGELYIGGTQLARGYLNRPQLTAERFIEHPEFGRLYKTGDLCRWLPASRGNACADAGSIEFMGRTDFQVKIRGFRIELGEIESLLLAQDNVREAVVLAREDNAVRGDKRLVAYLVGNADSHILRQQLAQRLPDYMIPSAFVILGSMPLTPNGKLDRRALPAPDYVDVQTEFVEPRNALEQQVAEIWRGVLGIEQVGIHDDFFALGGHSLLATQVISQVRAQLNLEVPLKSLFEAAHLAAFAHSISQAQTSTNATIRPVPRDRQLPLSFAQQRLWFLDQLEPDSAFYNIPTLIRLEGKLNVVALEQSFAYLIQRHESLRTTFDVIDGEPVQVIEAPQAFTLSVSAVDNLEQAQQRGQVMATTPFDLREGPLLRVELLKIAEHDYLLSLNMHHIISDGWSTGVLVEELVHAYTAYAQQNVPTLPQLPIQYADFAVWQREYLSGETLSAQLSFWREQLAGAPAQLTLPTDRPRPPVLSFRGAHYAFQLDGELTGKLNQLAGFNDATLFMVLLSAFNVLLSRYSRQTDIVVGSPIANRNRAEIEGLIGFFVNTLALRTELDDNPTFSALLNRVRENTLAAYEHQDLPFEQLVDELELERSLSYTPLFQVMLVLQNAEMGSFGLPNLTATPQPLEFPFAKFDLMLSLVESDVALHATQALRGTFEYNIDLFDEATIERMASHFTVLLNSIVSQPSQPVLELPMLTDVEYEQVVHEFNECAVNFGEPETIHGLFEQQVERTPDAPALVFKYYELTYYELNARANQLAHYLMTLGVEPNTVVAVATERSIEMIVGILATLKAGAAYLPIDTAYPRERIHYLLRDSQTRILLTTSRLADDLAFDRIRQVHLDKLDLAKKPIINPMINLKPDNTAYLIYTSGSTGQPKGVLMPHRAIWNLCQWQRTQLPFPARTLQLSGVSFDVACQELFTCWHSGGTLLLIEEYMRRDLGALLRFMVHSDAQRAFMPYVLLNALAEQATTHGIIPTSLRDIITAGEQLILTPAIRQLMAQLPNTTLHNQYGPTETHVVTSYKLSNSPEHWPVWVPIGRPIDNVTCYILDDKQSPVPIGVPGELYLGGRQLAHGYLNRVELTAEHFIEHAEFGRLYKTGDLCRWILSFDADLGNIEFMGRTDFQVKIRGFRIELGEIESTLLAQDGVREAVVLARDAERNPSDKRLVAYFVGNADSDTLRLKLAQRLPDYMIPSAFLELEAMPLTPNGKLDRRALPAPEYADTQTMFVPPRNALEQQLADIWARVLELDKVGIYDNFFALGGHSLLATQVVSHIQAQLNLYIPVKTIFETTNLAEFAEVVDLSTGYQTASVVFNEDDEEF